MHLFRKSTLFALAIVLTTAFAVPHLTIAQSADDAVQNAIAIREAEREEARIKAEMEARKKEQDDIRFEIASQKDAQDAAARAKRKQAQSAAMLGAGLTGMAAVTLIAAQFTEPPRRQSLEKWGGILMLGGMAASMVGQMVGMNANQSGINSDALNTNFDPDVPDLSGGPGDFTGGGTSKNPPILDPNSPALNSGDLGKSLDQFEAETGIPRENLVEAINSGIPPAEFLQGAGGLTDDTINRALSSAKEATNGGKLNSAALGKIANSAGLGSLADGLEDSLDPQNGEVVADVSGAEFGGGGSGLPGGGGSAGASTVAPLDFSALTGDGKDDEPESSDAEFNFERDVDKKIQRKLAAKGHVPGSIFDRVRKRYSVWSPIMLGYGPTNQTREQSIE